jgi:hypothetical protein
MVHILRMWNSTMGCQIRLLEMGSLRKPMSYPSLSRGNQSSFLKMVSRSYPRLSRGNQILKLDNSNQKKRNLGLGNLNWKWNLVLDNLSRESNLALDN